MDEKRKLHRWYPIMRFISALSSAEALVKDINTFGIRVSFLARPSEEEEIRGRLESPLNAVPFYIRGKITRVQPVSGAWETVIKIDKVSTSPFPA